MGRRPPLPRPRSPHQKPTRPDHHGEHPGGTRDHGRDQRLDRNVESRDVHHAQGLDPMCPHQNVDRASIVGENSALQVRLKRPRHAENLGYCRIEAAIDSGLSFTVQGDSPRNAEDSPYRPARRGGHLRREGQGFESPQLHFLTTPSHQQVSPCRGGVLSWSFAAEVLPRTPGAPKAFRRALGQPERHAAMCRRSWIRRPRALPDQPTDRFTAEACSR